MTLVPEVWSIAVQVRNAIFGELGALIHGLRPGRGVWLEGTIHQKWAPPPTTRIAGRFRGVCHGATCADPQHRIWFRRVPQRHSSYAAVSSVALAAASQSIPAFYSTFFCVVSHARHGRIAELSRPRCLWLSSGGINYLAYPSMPCDRDARGVPSSSAFLIGSRHPDLARP